MLKKKLGVEAIEERWNFPKKIRNYYKIPSTLIIPEECREIGNFAGCELKEVVIPEGVKEIMRDAFRECRKAEITLYNSSTKLNVGDSAFWNCKSRRYVEKETRS